MVKTKANILVNNIKWIYIAKAFSQLFTLLSTILVIRQIAVDVFGTFNLMLSSFVVFQILALSAVLNVFNRYIPELVANKEYHKFNRLIGGGILWSFLLFIILTIILYIKKDLFTSFFNLVHFDKYLIAFFVFIYSHFLQSIVSVILKAMLLHKKAALITIFTSALKLFLYLYFLQRLDVNLLLYIEASIGLVILISGFIIYSTHIKNFEYGQIKDQSTPVTLKRVRRYGLLSMVNEFGVGLIGRTSDYFIVAALSSSYQVGLYAFSHRIYRMVFHMLPFSDIMTVVRPLFFQKFTQNYDKEEFRNFYAFMIKLLVPIYVFPALYFFFFGQSIISVVFDTRYLDAYWITVVMISSNLFLAFFLPLSLTAQLKERMDILLYSKFIAVLSIFAGIYGMKLYGLMGVAMASLIGDLLKNLFILFLMKKYQEIKYRINDYKNFGILLLLLTPFLFLHQYILSTGWLIVASVVFIAYSIILFFFFHPFNSYDIKLLNNISETNPILSNAARKVSLLHNYLNSFSKKLQ